MFVFQCVRVCVLKFGSGCYMCMMLLLLLLLLMLLSVVVVVVVAHGSHSISRSPFAPTVLLSFSLKQQQRLHLPRARSFAIACVLPMLQAVGHRRSNRMCLQSCACALSCTCSHARAHTRASERAYELELESAFGSLSIYL